MTHELVNELIEVCGWLADGQSNPDEFRRTVTSFEARKLARFGYRLCSGTAESGVVQFSLRTIPDDELCASLDVNPATGEIVMQQAWI